MLDSIASMAEVASRLQELRARAGQPSFADLTRRVVALRRSRGVPAGEAHVGRVTVYDCFRPDRKRLDTGLVLDIVEALGGGARLDAWRTALHTLQLQQQAASLVTIADGAPTPTATFVGREAETAKLLDAPGPFWISGMPGVGKTQLVSHATQKLGRSRTVERVLTVDLRGYSPEGPPADPGAVADGLLRLFGIRTSRQQSEQERLAALGAQLERAGVLVILDDAASPQQVRAIVGDEVPRYVWVTSRSVPDDSLAARCTHLSLEPFSPDESTALLAAHVGAGKVAGDPESADEVARAAGHLPLAVDIAARRLASRPSWSMRDHVDQIRLRHRTLRLDAPVEQTFALSYLALPEEAARMLRLIAVHPLAQIDHASALALAHGEVDDADAALATLGARHMITQPREGWYRIHELVRLHASDISLDVDPPTWRQAAARRLTDCLVARAWAAYRARTAAIGEVPREPRVPLELPEMDTDEAEAFFRATTDLMLHIAHEPQFAHEGYSVVLALSETLTAWLDHVGRFRDAQELHEAALEEARRLGDREGEVRARVDLGMRLASVGSYDAADEHLRAVTTSADGHPREAVSAFNALGICCDRRGMTAEAEAHFRASIDGAQRLGDDRRLGNALSNLAGLFMRAGRMADCRATLLEATGIARRSGDRTNIARALVNLSSVHVTLDEPELGESTALEALKLFEALEQVPGVAICCSNIAAALGAMGRHEEALQWCDRGLEVCREIGMRQHETTLHMRRAASLLAMGQPDAGLEEARLALAVAEAVGDPYSAASARETAGDCLEALGRADDAEREWRAALALWDEMGAPEAATLRARLDGR